MPASEAQVAANRRNAAKSTGPRTAAGKLRSRVNAYKHGLTGAGVVLSTEDAEAVAGRFEGLMEEFSPTTIMGGILVKRAAMLSVRMDRSYVQEAANTSMRVASAVTALDDRRVAEAEHLLHTIHECPATNYRRLMATPEGVRVMIDKWAAMKGDLDHAEGCRWSYQHYSAADHLKGHEGGTVDVSDYYAWSMAIHGTYDYLRPEHFRGMKEDEQRRRHAMDRVASLIDGDIARLTDHLATLDPRAIESERAFAPQRALFDTSKEAVLARKYEAAAERGLYRALAELRQVEAEAEAKIPPPVAEPAGSPEVVEKEGVEAETVAGEPGSASFSPGPSGEAEGRPGAPRKPTRKPREAAIEPRSGASGD